THIGCHGVARPIFDFFQGAMIYGGTSASCFLDESRRTVFDSLLLFRRHHYRGVDCDKVLPHANPMFYAEIRKMLLEEGLSHMIIPLARYRKEQDRELILEFLRDTSVYRRERGLAAVSIFPDRIFEPVLQAMYPVLVSDSLLSGFDNTTVSYCCALAQYKAR